MKDTDRNPKFQVAHKTVHGDTLYTDHPLRSAMAMVFHLRYFCNITADYTKNEDGTVTVTGTALAPTTYERSTE